MRFNEKAQAPAGKGIKRVLNFEGELGYDMTPEMELYGAVCSSILQPTFYQSDDAHLERIKELIKILVAEGKAKFVAQLAIYAREEMHLRTIPLVLAVELSNLHKGDELVRRLIPKVVRRTDEITELLSFWAKSNKKEGVKKFSGLPGRIKKGLAQCFHSFNAYQFAKYGRETEVKIRDAMFLVHPKPMVPIEEELFSDIASKSLATPETWEVLLSEAGKEAKNEDEKKAAKKAAWEYIISDGKLGYMALLRNLRNILQANVRAEVLGTVCATLIDPVQVHKSQQLPFRFYSAFRELEEAWDTLPPIPSQLVAQSVGIALGFSADNLPWSDEDTVIAADVSGSMNQPISEKSKTNLVDVGVVLGALMASRHQNVLMTAFAANMAIYLMTSQTRDVMSLIRKIKSSVLGGSTEGWKVLDYMIKKKVVAKNVMFFTDCQLWDGDRFTNHEETDFTKLWNRYKAEVSMEAKLYIFDLAGHGNTPISTIQEDVYYIAGWSEGIFAMLKALREGKKALEVISVLEV